MVKGIPFEASEQDVKVFIHTATGEYKDISKISMILDRKTKKHRGTAFVDLVS